MIIWFIEEEVADDLVKRSFGTVVTIETLFKWVQERMGKEEMEREGIVNS